MSEEVALMSTRALFKLASIMLVVGCGADSARDLADNDFGVGPPGLTFADDAVREIARVAALANDRMENIGARRLHTVMATLMEDLLFLSRQDWL